MYDQAPPAITRSCYKCGYFAETSNSKCPQCGSFLHTSTATRIRGLLLMLCGVILFSIIGYVSIWALDIIYNGGPGKTQFTGTEQEKYGILALFAAITAFGVGAFITGAWQAVFGRRSKILSWALVAFAMLIFAGGLAIAFVLK